MPTHECRMCGAVFNSQPARAMHRHHTIGCRTPQQMKRIGMNQNGSGRWRAPRVTSATFHATTRTASARFAKAASRFT